jgi:hypothetical protein
MATVLEQKPNPAERFSSQVDEQIAQAASRIRTHDLAFGALTLAALVVAYAALMITLDKYLILSDWIRQLSFVGFVGAFAAATYWLIVRPLRNPINPLYAATCVEKTIEDAKNSVTGYVSVQETGNVPGAVKTAMSARAARAVVEADVNRAIEHRNLTIAGGVLAFLVLTLIVLFFVFRPAQFKSLLGRSFAPFSAGAIATKTQLTLEKPDPAEPTITTGQTITVAVHVTGKVPAKGSPERVRVLIRHNQVDPEFEEIDMKEGETSRDFLVKVPEDLVLNGFWYKVAAGDAETPEYRVTVRSLPLFTDFEATYEYPSYAHKSEDKSFSPDLRALPGTTVTLVARTNRTVTDGWMKFEKAGLDPVPGKPLANQPNSLVFKFTVRDQTKYKLFMTTTSGERNTDPPPYAINIDSDLPPTVQITRPEEVQTSMPSNGQLAVDASIGDDYGIDKVRLRIRVDGRDLAAIPYMGGKSFRRAADDTWPRDLEYKDSVDLTKLKYADGAPFEAKEGLTLEYWVEAIDNCSEAKPAADWDNQKGNVGRSPVKQVHLTAPKVSKDDQQQLNQEKSERKNQEQQHNQQQQQKFDNEKRENKPQSGEPQKGQNGQNQQPENQNGNSDPNNAKQENSKPKEGGSSNMGEPMNQNPDNKNQQGNPDNKNPDNKNQQGNPGQQDAKDPQNDPNKGQQGATNPQSAKTDPNMPPKPNEQPNKPEQQGSDPNMNPRNPENRGSDAPPPMPGTQNHSGQPDKSTNPMQSTGSQSNSQQSPEDKKAEEQARQVEQELNKGKNPEGETKPNSSAKPEERTDPASQKPRPQNSANADSQPKEQPGQNSPMNNSPMGGASAPSQPKAEGNTEKPTNPAENKPGPQQSNPNDPKQKTTQPAESREQPLGGTPGDDKPEVNDKKEQQKPGDGQKNPGESQPNKPEGSQQNPTGDKQPSAQKDPASGSSAKGGGLDQQQKSSGKPPGSESSGGNPKSEQQDPARDAGSSKPMTEPTRGQDKSNDKSAGNTSRGSASPKDGAAEPKPQQAPESSKPKPGSQDPMAQNGPGDSPPKPAPPEKGGNDSQNSAAQSKPEGSQQPKESSGQKNPSENSQPGAKPNAPQNEPQGGDKPEPQSNPKGADNQANGGDSQKPQPLDPKKLEELKNAANDLNSTDPQKRADAQNKLDKAIGEQKRKELEQFQKDLQSSDKATRDAAQKKAEDMMKQAAEQAKNENGGGQNQQNNQPDARQLEDLKNAASDLNNPDPQKRADAQNKLDKAIGEQKRKELEQLQKDLQSSDKATRDAAQKKAEDMMKQAAEQAKNENGGQKPNGGDNKELSKEEIRDLANKAKDLNSPDESKRKEAEKALDDKLGKEAREKLQDELKNQNPGDPKQEQDLEKKIDEQAKKSGNRNSGPVDPKLPRGNPGPSAEKINPPMKDDPRNRAKTAELQLEEFEKNRYNRDLQNRLGWTPEEYEKFLDAQRKRVEQLQKEAALQDQQQAAPPPTAPVQPTINANSGGKVEARGNGTKGSASGPGAVYAPPGFESANKKFNELIEKMQQKKP